MSVVACLKWVDQRPELADHGVAAADARFAGMSAADRSALELALRSAEQLDTTVTAISVGATGAAALLRDAIAAGAARAVHLVTHEAPESATVAALIAPFVADAPLIWCGDYSLDRGTGSVPAFLAAELGAVQALGLVEVVLDPTGAVRALRRLDGGRRERLVVNGPAVLSVEGGVAALRRATLSGTLAAGSAEIETHHPVLEHRAARRVSRPYRPRARVLPAPSGAHSLQRIQVLTDAAATPTRNEVVELAPAAAAHHLLEVLTDWGYLP